MGKKITKRQQTAKNKRKLWLIFSSYIRLRDAPCGEGECIACGAMIKYPNSSGNWHAGHFYPKGSNYAFLSFDEMNVHGCCCFCNTFLEGNTNEYRAGIIKRYGQSTIDYLEGQARKPIDPMFKYELEDLIEKYKLKLKDLKTAIKQGQKQ